MKKYRPQAETMLFLMWLTSSRTSRVSILDSDLSTEKKLLGLKVPFRDLRWIRVEEFGSYPFKLKILLTFLFALEKKYWNVTDLFLLLGHIVSSTLHQMTFVPLASHEDDRGFGVKQASLIWWRDTSPSLSLLSSCPTWLVLCFRGRLSGLLTTKTPDKIKI